ncbi:MAG: EamA family transporter [Desulfobacteraceae bacterium]|nr:EamA family transporter [Desulfobacteraceae bacterium]
MQTLGYLYILIAAMLWGFLGPFARLAFHEGISPLEVAFWRAVLAWLLFASQVLVARRVRVRRRDLPGLALFGFLCVTLFFGSYQVAVARGGAALASVLLYTAPAWVFLLSRLFFKERITPRKMAALVLTLGGIVLVSGTGKPSAGSMGPDGGAAVLFGLLAGFCYSLYYIFGKYFSDKYSAPVLFFYTLPFGAVCLLPWFSFAEKSAAAWAALWAIAFLSTFGAYHFYYAGLKRVEAGRASIIATAEPVVAALTAWCWWGERFTLTGYLGSGLILLAVLLMIRGEPGEARP